MKTFKYVVSGSIIAMNEDEANDLIYLTLGSIANVRRIEIDDKEVEIKNVGKSI